VTQARSREQYAHPRYGNVPAVADSKGLRGRSSREIKSHFIGFREPVGDGSRHQRSEDGLRGE
jgi:hypothetical protein